MLIDQSAPPPCAEPNQYKIHVYYDHLATIGTAIILLGQGCQNW